MRMNTKFRANCVAVHFEVDDDWGQKRTRMTLRYKRGAMHGEATYEVAYVNSGEYEIEEKVTVNYDGGKALDATHFRCTHGDENPYAQVTEKEPRALNVGYSQSVIWADDKEEGKKPVVTSLDY